MLFYMFQSTLFTYSFYIFIFYFLMYRINIIMHTIYRRCKALLVIYSTF